MANINVIKDGVAIPIPPYVVEKGDDAVAEYVDRFSPSVLAKGAEAVERDYEVKIADWQKQVDQERDAAARKYIADAGGPNAPKAEAAPAPIVDDEG